MAAKKIEIFCGTGGVGKTTLATARALHLASLGRKVLLITIDPAKRLKEVLKLTDQDAGKVMSVSTDIFEYVDSKGHHLDALLMSPAATLSRIQEQAGHHQVNLSNPILKALTRPYAGMNEIMGLLEVQHHHSSGNYDHIILDTPPGKHFIDFLQAAGKINRFFDKSFIEIFKYLGKSIKGLTDSQSPGIIGLIISTGMKKLLSYLEKVTGPEFVHQFVDAIAALYQVQESFREALKFQEVLKNKTYSNWFLVTSAQQSKSLEAVELLDEAQSLIHRDHYLAINKCLGPMLEGWIPVDQELSKLRDSLLKKEQKIRQFSGYDLSHIMLFPEVMGSTPQSHVAELASHWRRGQI